MTRRPRGNSQASRSSKAVRFDPTGSFPAAFAQLSLDKNPRGKSPFVHFTEWNKRAESLTGLKARNIVGKPLDAVFAESALDALGTSIARALKNGKSLSLRGLELVQTKHTAAVNADLWKLPSGIGILLTPAAGDVSEEDFSQSVSILDSITDAFFLLDGEWRFAYLSPKSEQFLRKLGLTSAEILGKNIWKAIPGTGSGPGFEQLQRAAKERITLEFEEYFKPLNTWFEVRVHPMGDGLSVYVMDITRRKLAETAFLKLSNAVEQSADGIFVTNLEGKIEYVNPAFESITGYRRAEVLGKSPAFLKSDSLHPGEFDTLWNQVKTGETFRATVSNRRKNGEIYFAEETITPVRDSEGAITNFVATVRDISERMRTEERFRSLIENSSDGIVLLTESGTISYTGPSTARILGYIEEDFTGRSGFEFIHPDDRTATERVFAELISSAGKIRSLEFRLRHKNGQWRWLEATANNLLDEPSIQAVVLNYRDITDRKAIEEALKKSEIEYRNLFDRANDAIFIFEPQEEMILEANDKACRMYGFDKNELIGMSLKNLTKDISRGEFEIKELMRHKSSRNFETVHFNKAGEPMEMLVNSSVVEYAGRTAIMSIIRDITELRKLEHQLRQAQKMEGIGTLAGGIAHDFNNILSIILGYTSLIKRGKIEGKKFEEGVDTIVKAAQRGAVLVKQILTFARKTDVVFESVKLNELLTDLARLLSETFPKTISFELRLDPDLPTIVADPNQLHQVFLNLCVNARDAMPGNGTITIQTSLVNGLSLQTRFPEARQSEYAHIRVTDTGSGMDEQTRLRVFEPFFTTKGQGRGTGLGLAVVYGIVNNHHGFIDLESTLGKGTTFNIYFPIQMRTFEAMNQGKITVEEVPGGNETILLVEDENVLLTLVKELLEGHGYKVLTAFDGEEAIETYERLKDEIHLVLTDIGLPKQSGWEVCRRVLMANPKAKVIVASGYIDPNVKSDLKDSRAREFIHKPYLPEDVLKQVRKTLDASD